jgi:hypothetical protein
MNAFSTRRCSAAEIVALLQVVAEPVEGRLQNRERLDVGLSLGCVGPTGTERNLHGVTGVRRRLFDGERSRQAR